MIGWKVGNESDPNDRVGEETAKGTLQVLCHHYPGYSWIVELKGGVLIIRNYTLDWRGRYCMVLKLADVQHDHKRLMQSVVRAGGEFLERAHQRRGPMIPGQESNLVLEGAPVVGKARWSPQPKKSPITIGILPEKN